MLYYYHERNDINEMEENEYKTIDLISDDIDTLKKHYVILLEYVKKLESKNKKLEKEKRELLKQVQSIKAAKTLLGLEELL